MCVILLLFLSAVAQEGVSWAAHWSQVTLPTPLPQVTRGIESRLRSTSQPAGHRCREVFSVTHRRPHLLHRSTPSLLSGARCLSSSPHSRASLCLCGKQRKLVREPRSGVQVAPSWGFPGVFGPAADCAAWNIRYKPHKDQAEDTFVEKRSWDRGLERSPQQQKTKHK